MVFLFFHHKRFCLFYLEQFPINFLFYHDIWVSLHISRRFSYQFTCQLNCHHFQDFITRLDRREMSRMFLHRRLRFLVLHRNWNNWYNREHNNKSFTYVAFWEPINRLHFFSYLHIAQLQCLLLTRGGYWSTDSRYKQNGWDLKVEFLQFNYHNKNVHDHFLSCQYRYNVARCLSCFLNVIWAANHSITLNWMFSAQEVRHVLHQWLLSCWCCTWNFTAAKQSGSQVKPRLTMLPAQDVKNLSVEQQGKT